MKGQNRNYNNRIIMKAQKITGDVRQKNSITVGTSRRAQHTFIPRNDPTDCFKPNSDDAVDILATSPIKEQLVSEDVELLRKVAADMDRSVPTDNVENYPNTLDLKPEVKEQMMRLPTWIRSMVECRWAIIYNHFGSDVAHFLSVVADIINGQYRLQAMQEARANDLKDEDSEIVDEINSRFYLKKSDMEKEHTRLDLDSHQVKEKAVFEVGLASSRWKYRYRQPKYWDTHIIRRAECVLRTAMITKASPADLAILAEEETFVAESDNDSEDDVQPVKKETGHWTIYGTGDSRDRMKQQAKETIKEEYSYKPNSEATRLERAIIKKQRKSVEQERKRQGKVGCWSYLKCHRLFQSRKERKKRKQAIVDRAVYRRYSRIWYKDCGENIHHSKKVDHAYRADEDVHQFVTTLVAWSFFKAFIMIVIIANAVLLALETGDPEPAQFFQFEVLDLLFLSLYLVEFLLKIYANPYKFWKSGYNIFDFGILFVSLLKTVLDWLDSEHIPFLRVLLIVRALRILRGVSLSVELQVLVTALAETIKTHVLSVVILLILLMYIAAVVAFYLFSNVPGLEDWNDVGNGMLAMFTFVTMDGWTDLIEHFEKAGYFYGGRAFGLILIVLGNFLFSNIFIAIIIMNISEATGDHLDKQRSQREGIVKRKKDIVFRRQKLDMRQLLARQRMSISADFFHMGCQFQRLLRHDDLVAMNEVCTSPLWMDCLFKTTLRCQYTSTMLLNLYREMADEFHKCFNLYKEDKFKAPTLRRGLYNRYMLAKARLSLLKRQMYNHRYPEDKIPLKIRLPPEDPIITKTPVQSKKEEYIIQIITPAPKLLGNEKRSNSSSDSAKSM